MQSGLHKAKIDVSNQKDENVSKKSRDPFLQKLKAEQMSAFTSLMLRAVFSAVYTNTHADKHTHHAQQTPRYTCMHALNKA